MNKKRNLLISFSAALLAAFLVYGVYKLQLRQVELQQTVNVLVPKDFIPAGTMIEAGMLAFRPVLAGSLEEGMFMDASQLVGLESVVPLGTNEPILSWKVDKYHLLPSRGQATFQIPKDYILSLSGGIRAGDKVRLYLSGGEGESARLFDQEITVASVKSSANVEVDNPKSPNLYSRVNGDTEKMYASRREANGTIDQINLNLTEEQWLAIDKACRTKKAKLVIAVSATSLSDDAVFRKEKR
ncbi:flagellar biosynthesis protein FlgA [Paenibacillus ginsengarvi]|uniref:Flagellar biosynthesis protein FlgA n=1 Tax=Paenibacillus ginsengarvi TaxID=400777 RepID=A0A3B0BGN5_9BACL|nr:flagellar biosynthesis protein FlgA [Paenibacillus ginsengarvi]RKN71850.1 flagellar biosynthesis protein FlgA [Paenibacillus ginsengarvi]